MIIEKIHIIKFVTIKNIYFLQSKMIYKELLKIIKKKFVKLKM